ncbi:MAG: TMEM14 family protein [Verrucomicrobiaceae bacterium]
MTTSNIVLWVYIVLLIAGGLVGFLKAGSKASLIASCVCAMPLMLAAFGVFGAASPKVAIAVLVLLVALFGYRFWKGRKFIPNGLMAILSLLSLAILAGFGGF